MKSYHELRSLSFDDKLFWFIDLYSSFKSIYLQDRENKIKNSTDAQDDWENLDN